MYPARKDRFVPHYNARRKATVYSATPVTASYSGALSATPMISREPSMMLYPPSGSRSTTRPDGFPLNFLQPLLGFTTYNFQNWYEDMTNAYVFSQVSSRVEAKITTAARYENFYVSFCNSYLYMMIGVLEGSIYPCTIVLQDDKIPFVNKAVKGRYSDHEIEFEMLKEAGKNTLKMKLPDLRANITFPYNIVLKTPLAVNIVINS